MQVKSRRVVKPTKCGGMRRGAHGGKLVGEEDEECEERILLVEGEQ